MKIAHLTASTFFGGPERQMIALAQHLPRETETAFLSFAEGGRCHSFLANVRKAGFEGNGLKADTPQLFAAVAELSSELARLGAQVLCCHGYKADLVGRLACRRLGIAAVAVARGWTGENLKVRLYEMIDRLHLRFMDHVVCVSEAQAAKVRRAGVAGQRVSVIANAVEAARFADPEPLYRNKLLRAFRDPVHAIVGAAGRLSPEKGFDVFVKAASIVHRRETKVGFALFGTGPCKDRLAAQINALGLSGCFVMKGLRQDLDRFIPFFDLLALPSHTEGLPNVVLEALAAGVPVVATAVGGTPELVTDGANGFLVPPGNADELAAKILQALACPERLREISAQGRETVSQRFTFEEQANRYQKLFEQFANASGTKHIIDSNKSGSTQDAGRPMPPRGLVYSNATCDSARGESYQQKSDSHAAASEVACGTPR
jgi:glycosyltransferase involved in cell wall biosynthesis